MLAAAAPACEDSALKGSTAKAAASSSADTTTCATVSPQDWQFDSSAAKEEVSSLQCDPKWNTKYNMYRQTLMIRKL